MMSEKSKKENFYARLKEKERIVKLKKTNLKEELEKERKRKKEEEHKTLKFNIIKLQDKKFS